MAKSVKKPVRRSFDARRDTADFRDLMFVPTLIEVPTTIPLADYLKFKVPVLDQGSEGACTGFGLATVANCLLLRRKVVPDAVPVSPRMFYEMARRYDEWPGENYSGSSARGAMKGWHKHGVTSEKDWPYALKKSDPRGFTAARAAGALKRPLGAYFRVNHRDLIAMHTAIAEVGVLYATASVHAGWSAVGKDGLIAPSDRIEGGHAFAIVAYDAKGFWIQNSWGTDWGKGGMARIGYDDWLANATDVWVARLGAPVVLRDVGAVSIAHAATSGQSAAYAYAEIRPHIVAICNDGALRPGGDYGTSPAELQQIFEDDIPRTIKGWAKPRLLLYAHGGLVSERAAVQRVAEYRKPMLDAEVYPLAFIWRSDYWTTITNILQDAMRRRRPEGVLDAAKDFLLDRLDDALEPIARVVTGKAAWDEMKENAVGASAPGGGAQLAIDHVGRLLKAFPTLEIHLVGHSAGAVFHAPLVQLLATRGLKIASCTLWAPACRMDLFKAVYLPAVQSKAIGRFAVFVLDDATEQDDNCAKIYNKSLLYLVSNAFESPARIPLLRDGVPLLGLRKSIESDAAAKALFAGGQADLVVAPNARPQGAPDASGARHHGDVDDDNPNVLATLARLTGAPAVPPVRAAKAGVAPAPAIRFMPSPASLRERRLSMDAQTQVRR